MIQYQVQRNTRSRNLRLKITAKGDVVVSAPPRVSEQIITRFVHEHTDWIIKHQAQLKAKHKISNPDEVMIFGKTYQRQVEFDKLANSPVYITGETLHIHPVSRTEASAQRTLETFLKATAQKYIIPRTKQLAKIMNTTYTTITLRDQKTRWGSCSSTGALNFNWRLVQYPPAVIDYVIVHELAHRTEMNHSARFWAIVAKYDPEYPAHRRWLKKNGSTVE